MAGEGDTLLLLVLAFIFPPAAVAFISGCGADLCLNLLLTLLGWFPGCIHAFWLIFKRTEANETYGYQNWRYAGMGEYQPRNGAPTPAQPQGQPPPPPGQYPATYVPPPTQGAQAPVDQKGVNGYTAQPPAPTDSKSEGHPATDQKSAPPPTVPRDQAPPPQAPPDQKQADAQASAQPAP